VTPVYAGSDTPIRVTFPGGAQAAGRVRVIDEYSGLALVKTDADPKDDTLPDGITLADQPPPVGAWVLSAAGWGVEKPVLSLGIVSGTARTLTGLTFPPLLQCDLRTAKTSSGAAVVNQEGQLVGVVVVADRRKSDGWTYAVPVRHVRRLVRKYEENRDNGSFVVMKRRRPEVGMVLDGRDDRVQVARVRHGSPAERAGLKVGDLVVEVDGVAIRSVYQALRPVLVKQPGDAVTFTIDSSGQRRDVRVVLAGEVELPAAPFANLSRYVQPKIDVERNPARVRSNDGQGSVREVYADDSAPANAAASDGEKIKLLEKSLDRYLQVIRILQQQLADREQERQRTEQRLEELLKRLESKAPDRRK